MRFYTAKFPTDYQEFFYQQVGLQKNIISNGEIIWQNEKNDQIHSYGSIDKIQYTFGCYTIPTDFLVEYQYHATYLHFGIIYEGITYSLVNDKLVARSIPSTFLCLEKASNGINCWKRGQHFKGFEISIDFHYLTNVLLPILGLSNDCLNFLEENVRYVHLSDELQHLITHMEQYLKNFELTLPLQLSLCLEFLSLMIHKKHRSIFYYDETAFSKYITLGKRQIRLSKEDFKKILLVHESIKADPSSFATIYELSKDLQISEQKLKAGFKEIYQQTIWEYANMLRMNQAVNLLLETELSISEIAKQIGYQSQPAFITMFKKWCGVTPKQFRLQMTPHSPYYDGDLLE